MVRCPDQSQSRVCTWNSRFAANQPCVLACMNMCVLHRYFYILFKFLPTSHFFKDNKFLNISSFLIFPTIRPVTLFLAASLASRDIELTRVQGQIQYGYLHNEIWHFPKSTSESLGNDGSWVCLFLFLVVVLCPICYDQLLVSSSFCLALVTVSNHHILVCQGTGFLFPSTILAFWFSTRK